MNVSKNLLHVSLPDGKHYINQSSHFYIPPNDTSFVNVPPILYGKEVLGYREVFWEGQHHVLVKITELYPVPGRQHYNLYNVSKWSGWKVIGDTGVGQSVKVGNWGSTWAIPTGAPYDIGNRMPVINNEYFQTTSSGSTVIMKKAGVYHVEIWAAWQNVDSQSLVITRLQNGDTELRKHMIYGYTQGYWCSCSASTVLTVPDNYSVKTTMSRADVGRASAGGDCFMQVTKIG